MTDIGYTRSRERPLPKANGSGDREYHQSPLITSLDTAPIIPFDAFDAGDWEGQNTEPRQWIVHDRIPRGEPGILSGDGGTGKTKLALQLAAAVAAGLPDWIGGVVDIDGPVLMFSAEEKLKEMHRRMTDVLCHRKLPFSSLSGRFHFICDPEDPVLGKTDRNGVLEPTESLLRLERTVAMYKPVLVIIENAADVYAGNENDRFNVTCFVRRLLGSLTRPSDATVMLLQHPSVTGLSDGTGRAGSTAWNNAGRWRNHFTTIKSRDQDDFDLGLRQYEVIKNNYGPTGEKVQVRWDRGVFVPVSSIPTAATMAAEAAVDEVFLKCLDIKTAQQISVGPSTGKNYAPAVFEKMAEAGGYKAKAFALAMERLLSAGRIIGKKEGPPSKQRTILVRKGAT
jgi:RecA-family ATPase